MSIQEARHTFSRDSGPDCQAFAVRPMVSPRYHRMHRFHRVPWNPVFKPSHESLLLQNAEIDRLNLPRIRDDRQLQQLIGSGELVAIVPSESLRIQHRLIRSAGSAGRGRWILCKTSARHIQGISRTDSGKFGGSHSPSSEKTSSPQSQRGPESGETASSHLAGLTLTCSARHEQSTSEVDGRVYAPAEAARRD